jgi:hypothetical protein
MGLCFAIRPLTAVAVSLVLGGWLVLEATTSSVPGGVRRVIGSAVTTGLATAAPTLFANHSVTGSLFSFPYSMAGGSMYGVDNIPFGIRNLDALLISFSPGLYGWGWPITTHAVLLALPLSVSLVPFLTRRARNEDWLLLTILVVVALSHLPTRANGLHGYGARYAFDVAGCAFLLTARGFRELTRMVGTSRVGLRIVTGVFLALSLSTLATLPKRLELYRGYYDITGELQRQFAATGLDEAVILVAKDRWWPWGEGARLITGPRRHQVVISTDLGDNSALEEAFPERPLLLWDGSALQPAAADRSP